MSGLILGACVEATAATSATSGTAASRATLFFVPAAAADAPAVVALPPATFAAAAPRMALTIWAVPGSRGL